MGNEPVKAPEKSVKGICAHFTQNKLENRRERSKDPVGTLKGKRKRLLMMKKK